eukprot:gene5387-7470_t
MPLDITLFRAHSGGNPELIRESQRRRFASVELVDEIITKDEAWRLMTGDIDQLNKKRNTIQKEVGNKKKNNEFCDDLIEQIKSIGDEIAVITTNQKNLKVEIDKMINKIGNIVDDSVPVSKDEDKDNAVIRKWGVPRDPAGLLNHHDLLWRIGGYEPERGANVAGHRGYFLRDVGVLLNQAFINYGIAFLRAREYTVIQPPYMMKKDVMAGVAQLEQFDEELYKVGGDADDKYLIATSEQPICAYHMGEWIEEKSLPIRYSGISTCFRKEAGSHGKDTWGIFRVHQFEKVEQFAIVEGDLAVSQAMQEEMIKTAEEFYQSLGFPYHVINIVSGALNNAAIRKYDLECWFPGYNAYRELVSCSNCTDYQSRAMEIRCGGKKMGEREKKYVHMLNATLCATGRAICCLLETYQTKDGVNIPEKLVPFMGGITFLPFVRDSKLPANADKSQKATPVPASAPVLKEESKPTPVVAVPSDATASPIEKKQVATATGAPKQADSDKKKEKKEKPAKDNKAGKAEPVPVVVVDKSKSLPPAIPVLPPAYTTPAPVNKTSVIAPPPSATISLSELIENGKVNIEVLDDHLKTYSYVGGYLPNKLDASVYEAIKVDEVASATASVSLNTKRWLRNIANFSEADKLAWK